MIAPRQVNRLPTLAAQEFTEAQAAAAAGSDDDDLFFFADDNDRFNEGEPFSDGDQFPLLYHGPRHSRARRPSLARDLRDRLRPYAPARSHASGSPQPTHRHSSIGDGGHRDFLAAKSGHSRKSRRYADHRLLYLPLA